MRDKCCPRKEKEDSFFLTIRNDSPIEFDRYTPKDFNGNQLKTFEGNYDNDELDIIYQLKANEGQLQILIEGRELVSLQPISQNIFRAEHFGYLKFETNTSGKITGFIRNDDHVFGMHFSKLKK